MRYSHPTSADPLTRRALDEMEQERRARERASTNRLLGLALVVFGGWMTVAQIVGSAFTPREFSVDSLLQFAGDVPAIFIMIAGLVLLGVADHWRWSAKS